MKAAGYLSQSIPLLSNKSTGMTTVIDAAIIHRRGPPIAYECYQHRVDLNASTAGFARLADFVIEQRYGAIER